VNGASYNIYRDRYCFLRDSYLGGDRYRLPSAASLSEAESWKITRNDTGQVNYAPVRRNSYLVPHPRESDDNFVTRLRLAIYINLVQPIVDAYAEACTANVKRETGTLDLDDVDAQGTTWGECTENAARWAALYGWVIAVVDAPEAIGALTIADELAAEIKPRVVTVEPAAVAWICTDYLGRLTEFAYVEQAYKDEQSQAYQTVTVRVFKPGKWEVRRGTFAIAEGIAANSASYSLVAEGALAPAFANRLPVHILYYRRIAGPHPLGQSLVEDAADIGRAIYNALSWANETHRKAGFPFLAVPMGSTGGQMDANTARTIGPDQGFPYDANTGAPQWVQPSAESTQELREHCNWLFQMALRTAGLEVAADASAQVQSGEALRIRSRDFEARAARFARNLQRWEKAVLADFALLAGEPTVPQVTYPSVFTLPDPSEDLANALSILKDMPVEIGVEPKARAVVQALRAALSIGDDDAQRMMHELVELYSGDMQEFNEDRKARSAQRLLEIKQRAAEQLDGSTNRAAPGGSEPGSGDRIAEGN
jgi:hypothetical protein